MSTDEYRNAHRQGLKSCHHCHTIMDLDTQHCPECGSLCFPRKRYSLQNTVAWLLTSVLLFIPANVLPIMTTYSFGEPSRNTIISGVIHLWEQGSYLISLVIFLASFVVPLGKIISLSWLCISVFQKDHSSLQTKTRVYQITELLGKWSMIDVFVVMTLVTLVQLGHTIAIHSNSGVLAFAGVVICSMFAAHSFDPRLLWDLHPES
jgi:paraquat-inducible protein A